jgi:hypothetical protein
MAYIKDGLVGGKLTALEAHLRRCPDCAAVVEEARAMDARLQLAARLDRPVLSPAASARIQERVYRRMRRTLFLRRVGDLTGQLGGALVFLAFLIGLVLFANPRWHYVEPAATTTPIANLLLAREEGYDRATPPAERPGEAQAVAGEGHTPVVDRPAPGAAVDEPAEPRQPPLEAVQAAVESALGGDEFALRSLAGGGPPFSQAMVRAWKRLGACEDMITAGELEYELISHGDRHTSVRVAYAGRLAGEMKLGLDFGGRWRLLHMNYASFTALNSQCRAAATRQP